MVVGLIMFGLGVGWIGSSSDYSWFPFFTGFILGCGAVLFCQGLQWLMRDVAQKPWKGKP